MSLANKTDVPQRQVTAEDRKSQSRGFLLALICMALFVLLAHLMFPPLTSGGGTDGWLVGP